MNPAFTRQETFPEHWCFAGIIGVFAALSACSGPSFRAGEQVTDQVAGGSGGDVGHSSLGAGTSAGQAAGSGGGSAGDGIGGTSAAGGSGQGNAAGEPDMAANGGEAGVGAVPTCPHGSGRNYSLKFYQETRQEILQDVHPFFQVLSVSGESISLSRLKIRYYYTKEAAGSETGSCFWVTGDHCSLVKFAFADVVPSMPTADRMMEVSFPGAKSGNLGLEALEVRTGFTVSHANLKQSNDYSFDPAVSNVSAQGAFPYAEWDHVTLYVDDQLEWGTEPCSAND